MVCSSARYVMIAGLAGLAASSISGSDAVGWIAAGVVAGLLLLAARLFPAQFGGGSCAVPTQRSGRQDAAGSTDGTGGITLPVVVPAVLPIRVEDRPHRR